MVASASPIFEYLFMFSLASSNGLPQTTCESVLANHYSPESGQKHAAVDKPNYRKTRQLSSTSARRSHIAQMVASETWKAELTRYDSACPEWSLG